MFKHYGKYAQRFVRAIAAEQKSHRANDEMMNMARYMRAKSYEYNNEHPNNEAIIRDIRIMAGGNISIDLDAINAMRSEYRQNQPSRNMKGRKQQQRNGRKQQRNTQKNQARHNAHK